MHWIFMRSSVDSENIYCTMHLQKSCEETFLREILIKEVHINVEREIERETMESLISLLIKQPNPVGKSAKRNHVSKITQ